MDFSAQMTRFHNAKRKLFDKLYDHLNERQREAVFSVNGPLLVLAGAGTGKTTVLVDRISHIIKYGNAYYDETPVEGMTDAEISAMESAVSLPDDEIAAILGDFVTSPCPPWNILCFTFTNKAANEMKERLGRALGEDIASEIWAGTFHSICVRLLRRFGSSLGYNEHFTIYDTDDTKKAIADCLHKLNIDDKILPVKYVMKEISRLKDSLKSPSDYSKEVGNDSRKRYVQLVYTLYQKTLLEASALDFDDIIVQTVNLLSTNEEAASYCRNKFRYISVDEFQDTNYAQLRLIELLSEGRRNLMVVGDDDQSIYKFRGATIANILNFDRQFSDAKVVKLEENYRSTSNILAAANGIISHNVGRHQKSLFTKAGEGDKITVQICENQNEEARYIVNEITRNILSKKLTYSDFAVLYRMNSQSNSIESVLKRSGIPYRLIGGTRFYDRKEIKDIMAYLSVVNNPADNLRLKRIINEPKRKIGEKLISDIELIAAANGVSMFDVIDSAELYPQIVRSAGRLKEFANLIKELRNIMETEPLSVLFDRTI
ncbi:MAG: UvrD-helicase domain-containing protein [Firmicutes bacterium]|nr:UvrD-helicase domain-containing protein [Candidatus Colimorpha enterica]